MDEKNFSKETQKEIKKLRRQRDEYFEKSQECQRKIDDIFFRESERKFNVGDYISAANANDFEEIVYGKIDSIKRRFNGFYLILKGVVRYDEENEEFHVYFKETDTEELLMKNDINVITREEYLALVKKVCNEIEKKSENW